jgi:hypothetical protein
MSVEAIIAAKRLTGSKEFIEALATVDTKHRPSNEKATLVIWALADAFQKSRGYVNETVEQLNEVLPFTVDGHLLSALDGLGIWVVSKRGGPGSPTQRVPGPLLAKHNEQLDGIRENGTAGPPQKVDPNGAELVTDDDSLEPTHGGQPPQDESTRGGTRGGTHGGLPPYTPTSTPTSTKEPCLEEHSFAFTRDEFTASFIAKRFEMAKANAGSLYDWLVRAGPRLWLSSLDDEVPEAHISALANMLAFQWLRKIDTHTDANMQVRPKHLANILDDLRPSSDGRIRWHSFYVMALGILDPSAAWQTEPDDYGWTLSQQANTQGYWIGLLYDHYWADRPELLARLYDSVRLSAEHALSEAATATDHKEPTAHEIAYGDEEPF